MHESARRLYPAGVFLSVIVCFGHSMMSVKKESREADFFKTMSDDVVNPFPRQKNRSREEDFSYR